MDSGFCVLECCECKLLLFLCILNFNFIKNRVFFEGIGEKNSFILFSVLVSLYLCFCLWKV